DGQAESRTRGCDFHVFHDWSLVHLITRPTSGLSVHDLAARENGNWLRLMVSRCPGRITCGHPAMWAQCPVCPKADMVGRFMSTRLSLTTELQANRLELLGLSENTLGVTGAGRVDVLGPESETDDAGRNSLQDRPATQEADNPGQRWGRAACQHAAQKLVVNEDLHPLRSARWKHAPA